MNSPRRNSFPVQWSEYAHVSPYRKIRPSFTNDRALNPSISGAEQDSSSDGRYDGSGSIVNQRLAELSIGSSQGTVICKPVFSRTSNVSRTKKLSPAKVSYAPKKQIEPQNKREMVSSLHLLVQKRMKIEK